MMSLMMASVAVRTRDAARDICGPISNRGSVIPQLIRTVLGQSMQPPPKSRRPHQSSCNPPSAHPQPRSREPHRSPHTRLSSLARLFFHEPIPNGSGVAGVRHRHAGTATASLLRREPSDPPGSCAQHHNQGRQPARLCDTNGSSSSGFPYQQAHRVGG